MKRISVIGCLVMAISFIACKKYHDDLSLWPDKLNQHIFYKTVATIPSPADSVKGLSDSLSVSRTVDPNAENMLTNIPNVDAQIWGNGYGFSFGYAEHDGSRNYFIFSS